MRCVGLDLGTTKISGVLIDTDPPPGRVLGVVSREHGAGRPAARPWEHLQDPERILAAAREVLRGLHGPAGPAQVRWDGMCVTGQMHGVLYADAGGRAVSPLMSWLDNRAGQPHPAGGTWAQRLSAAVGRPIAAGYGAATHFYNRHHGLVPPRAAYLCTLMDYVTWRLTGGPAAAGATAGGRPVADATIAASVGLADPLTGRPDPPAWREAELDGLLPSEVVEAGSRVGSTAGEGGLPEGVPVFAPLGDNQAGFLGAVRDVEAMTQLNVGTGGQISAWLPALSGDAGGKAEAGLEARPFPGGGVLLVGATLCAGQAYALLEEFFRGVLEAFGGRAEEALFERMNALAVDSAGPGAGPEPRVDTRFNGTREDPRITGSIEGISLRNLTPAALVRGLLSGIAGELHDHYAALVRRRAAVPDGLVGSGNGLRRNPALRAEITRRFGLPLRVPRLREEAALGAALAAAVGLGRYPGFRAAGQIIRYEAEEDADA
jgi:sedoheptulokinase